MSSERIDRCYTDNIYLIESLPPEEEYERQYKVMGNSGKTYTVTVAKKTKCTCPDYLFRRNRCKHIYFVLIRIMNVQSFDKTSYTKKQLLEMFENIPHICKNLMYQGEINTEQKEVSQKFDKGDICPVCLDPLENGKELDYCKYSCGKTVHKKCFNMWEKAKGSICVFCRGQWYSNNSNINPKKVSMHPIDDDIEIPEEDIDSNINRDFEKINIDDDEENHNDDDEEEDEDEEESNYIRYRNKKRNKSRSISRNKKRSKSKNRYKSRSRSRSRSRDKIKKKKKYKYPKD